MMRRAPDDECQNLAFDAGQEELTKLSTLQQLLQIRAHSRSWVKLRHHFIPKTFVSPIYGMLLPTICNDTTAHCGDNPRASECEVSLIIG